MLRFEHGSLTLLALIGCTAGVLLRLPREHITGDEKNPLNWGISQRVRFPYVRLTSDPNSPVEDRAVSLQGVEAATVDDLK